MENSPGGSFVCHVAVTDADSQLNAQIDCSLDSHDFRLISLPSSLSSSSSSLSSYSTSSLSSSSLEYKLVTTRALDRESSPQQIVTIRCRDGGIPHLVTSKTFAVQVSDD